MLTSISMGNNDIIAYATSGDYLVNHSLIESFSNRVHLTVDNLLHDGYRWGTPMIPSFFMALFGLSGYQYTYLFQTILFSLMLPLTYVLLRILYKPGFLQGFLVVLITALNSNLLYMLYHNFFGQVLFWGIEMLIFIFYFSYFATPEEKKSVINIYDLLIALTMAVLFFSYHEPVAFMILPLGFFLLWRVLSRAKPLQYFKKLLLIAVTALGLGAVSIFNATIFDFGQTFASNKNQPIGWELFRQKIPYANPFEALGFYSIHSFDPLPNLIAIALSLLTIFVIIWGIIKSRQKSLIISFTTVFFIFLLWTGPYLKNFFAYNRALTYILPFFIVLFAIGFSDLSKKRFVKKIVLLIILTGLLSLSALKLNKKFRTIYVAVDKSMASLRDVPLDNIKEPIYTEGFLDSSIPYWVQNWTGYFIYGNSFSHWPTKFNDGSSLNKVPDNSLVLSGKYSRWYYPPKRVVTNVVWENEYYKIARLCNSDNCLTKSGIYAPEVIIGQSTYEDTLLITGWDRREGESRCKWV
ncbi:YfhO family protein, partial [Patescibacteria group bacterium]|nr:YfhO family protein [Patescibacteria group bacterium]